MSDATITRLETERLILRPNRPDDFEAWEAFFTTERSAYVGGPSTRGKAWRSLAAEVGHWALKGFGPFAIERREDGAYVGQLLVWSPIDWPENEIGWYLWEAYEGHGYAHEAALRARTHAYEDLGWSTAVSYIDPNNHRSRRLAERLGAVEDPAAQPPDGHNCLVYRHPAPAAL